MKAILSISKVTFLEAIRQRILYVMGGFAALLIVASLFLAQLTIDADAKMIMDLGLGAIFWLNIFLALYFGVQLIFRDLERRTVYTLLAKPVSYVEVFVGKYLGLCAVIVLNASLMHSILVVVLKVRSLELAPHLWVATLLGIFEAFVVAACAMMFAAKSSTFLSLILTALILLWGHATPELLELVQKKFGIGPLYYVSNFLNFSHFARTTEIVHHIVIPTRELFSTLIYTLTLALVFLNIGIFRFSRREIDS